MSGAKIILQAPRFNHSAECSLEPEQYVCSAPPRRAGQRPCARAINWIKGACMDDRLNISNALQ